MNIIGSAHKTFSRFTVYSTIFDCDRAHKRGQPITNTSELAMKHSATERTRELATPKRVPASYKPARSIEWPVKGKLPSGH